MGGISQIKPPPNENNLKVNREGKFLKKLWCCVGGRVKKGNLVLSTELITLIGHRKQFQS